MKRAMTMLSGPSVSHSLQHVGPRSNRNPLVLRQRFQKKLGTITRAAPRVSYTLNAPLSPIRPARQLGFGIERWRRL